MAQTRPSMATSGVGLLSRIMIAGHASCCAGLGDNVGVGDEVGRIKFVVAVAVVPLVPAGPPDGPGVAAAPPFVVVGETVEGADRAGVNTTERASTAPSSAFVKCTIVVGMLVGGGEKGAY